MLVFYIPEIIFGFRSVSATCLSIKNNPRAPWAIPLNQPGDLVDLNAFCRNSLGNPNARADPDPNIAPDDMCYSVRCEYPPPCQPPSQAAVCKARSNFPAPDGAVCSANGVSDFGLNF